MIATVHVAARRACSLLLATALLAPGAALAQDHAGHNEHSQHAGHENHQMTETELAVLRERIPLYKEYNEQQIMLEMQMMGADEARYLSPDSVRGDIGVLVLIHGFGETGNRVMQESVQPLGSIFPTAMGAGMAMMGAGHIQSALDDLVAAGAKKVIVVPMASSAHNTLIYQWQHALGLREQGAFLDVAPAQADVRLVVTDPPAGHPLIREILLDHVLELSTRPADEVVFLVAHGPVFDKENELQLETMARDAERIKALGGFADVQGITLQDDAASAVRAANVEKLRAAIEAAQRDNKKVIVVSTFLAARSIQWKIERDLAGLDYQFSLKGIANHPKFTTWFQETVMDAVKQL